MQRRDFLLALASLGAGRAWGAQAVTFARVLPGRQAMRQDAVLAVREDW